MKLHPILSFILLPFSYLYTGITCARNFLYEQGLKKSYHAPVPVLSLGNLSTGGTGKTPMAEYVIRYMLKKGKQPAYLSRGYGRKSKGYMRVFPQKGASADFGDEAMQVAEKFPQIPVAVSEDRRKGIEHLLKENPDLIILDDAFQHRKVARDLDILLLDANRLPYEDRVLPAGSLRESIKGIERADLLIVNKLSSASQIAKIGKNLSRWRKPLCFAQVKLEEINPFHTVEKGLDPEVLKQREVILFSGIGNADFFERQVKERGFQVVKHFRFGDHYEYKETDFHKIWAAQGDKTICITTEKDYFRLKGSSFFQKLSDTPCYYLPIHLEFLAGEEILIEKLESLNLKESNNKPPTQ